MEQHGYKLQKLEYEIKKSKHKDKHLRNKLNFHGSMHHHIKFD